MSNEYALHILHGSSLCYMFLLCVTRLLGSVLQCLQTSFSSLIYKRENDICKEFENRARKNETTSKRAVSAGSVGKSTV